MSPSISGKAKLGLLLDVLRGCHLKIFSKQGRWNYVEVLVCICRLKVITPSNGVSQVSVYTRSSKKFMLLSINENYHTLTEIYWGLSTAKYSSTSHSLFRGTPVLHFTTAVRKV